MRSRLAPIIGENGFRILFARSLHRARVDHPWLAREALQPDKPFSSLKTSLESQPPERAAQGNRTLGNHFDALVHALIGKALADRLLAAPIGPLRRANQEKNP